MVFNLSHDYQYMYMLLPTLLKGYKIKSNSPILIWNKLFNDSLPSLQIKINL